MMVNHETTQAIQIMSPLRFFRLCIAFIVFSQIWSMTYDFLYTTKGSFYTGPAGVSAILITLADVVLMLAGTIALVIGRIRDRNTHEKYLDHFFAGIAVIIFFYFLSDLVWRYSIKTNLDPAIISIAK